MLNTVINIDYNVLLKKIEIYVHNFFTGGGCTNFCYHNEAHTNAVVENVLLMAEYYKLNDEDTFVLKAAAYFHDTGYAQGGPVDHELRGAQIAREFLEQEGVEAILIDKIVGCILATKMPQKPNNLLEQIICDADLYHLGTPSFWDRDKLMHQEAERLTGKKIGKSAWRESTIKFLEGQNYHTEYAKNKLGASKQENLNELIKKRDKSLEKDSSVLKSSKKPERGIETMFRITSTNNQRLSDMADNKANLLLTVNSIILSLIVTVLLRSLDKNTHLIIPTILLMSVIVIVMVLAILATIPKIPSGYFTEEQVSDKSVNLLFFGNFYKMPLDTYKSSMDKAMNDSAFLYGMLTKDVYSQGVVLGRKYRLLRYAYGTFMFGLIASILGFVIALLCL